MMPRRKINGQFESPTVTERRQILPSVYDATDVAVYNTCELQMDADQDIIATITNYVPPDQGDDPNDTAEQEHHRLRGTAVGPKSPRWIPDSPLERIHIRGLLVLTCGISVTGE